MILPFILSRLFGIGVFRKGKATDAVALTFDDGPDPVYTPQLLDLLKRHQVKATFFILGARAERFPELIRRIHEEGHEIGIHNYTHKSNWIMLPRTVRKHIVKSADAVEAIIGVRPYLYRPPWGSLNVFDFRLPKTFKTVLWSVMAGDWSVDNERDRKRMTERLIRRIRGGSVVLLHDCGDTLGAKAEAPRFMLEALAETLEKLQPRGYRYITVSEMMKLNAEAASRWMSRTRRVVVAVWLRWERLFAKMFRIRPIDEHNTLIKLRIREYTGDRPIYLQDGECIRKGDRIAELHLDNELLFRLGTDARSTMQLTVTLIRRVEQLLPQLSRFLANDPEFRDVKGLYGITIIHRGTAKFGFTVVDLPKGVFAMFTKLYLRLLLYVIHPRGGERLHTKTELLVPKIVAISKRELLNRYPAA
jgi:peptidoglycan/xylan/chitin deacetylase (PgdA/CDA1 family)